MVIVDVDAEAHSQEERDDRHGCIIRMHNHENLAGMTSQTKAGSARVSYLYGGGATRLEWIRRLKNGLEEEIEMVWKGKGTHVRCGAIAVVSRRDKQSGRKRNVLVAWMGLRYWSRVDQVLQCEGPFPGTIRGWIDRAKAGKLVDRWYNLRREDDDRDLV